VIIAEVPAALTLASIHRVPHIQWLTVLTVGSLRVVVALKANISLFCALTVAVFVALTLCCTIAADITKVAAAHIRLYTVTLISALM